MMQQRGEEVKLSPHLFAMQARKLSQSRFQDLNVKTQDCQDGKTTKHHLSEAGLVPLPPPRLHLDHLARLPLADVQVADPA